MFLFLSLLFTGCSTEEAPVVQPNKTAEKAVNAKHEEHKHPKAEGVAPTEKPPAGAKVMFVSPADGAKLKSPVKVVFGLEGMKIQPAGKLTSGTGHHHLMIDAKAAEFGQAVPADAQHIHFGKGQTETEVELKPGEHTLVMQFADGVHRSYGPQMSSTIKITVE